MTGLIVAMRREARPLLRIGMPPGCTLVHCGVGLERARAAAASFIESARPSLLVSFGIAGGVEEDLQVGDVVVPESVRLLGGAPPLPLARLSPGELSAAEAAVSARGARLYRGTVVTTRGEAVHPGTLGDADHPVLDMETWGIAEASARYGVPLLCLRGLSDSFREPLPFDLSALAGAGGTFRAGRLLGQAARHPGVLLRLARLSRNTRRAEENVTAAVLAVLAFRLT